MWKQLSEEQRHSYGEDYFEAALRSLEKYTEAVSLSLFSCFWLKQFVIFWDLQPADFTPIIRSLIDATTRTFPLERYTPVTRSEKIRTITADYFPRSLYDALYRK